VSEDIEAFCRIIELCPADFELNGDLSHYLYRGIKQGAGLPRLMAKMGHMHQRMAREHGDLSADVPVRAGPCADPRRRPQARPTAAPPQVRWPPAARCAGPGSRLGGARPDVAGLRVRQAGAGRRAVLAGHHGRVWAHPPRRRRPRARRQARAARPRPPRHAPPG
jgi:hypothetical protein